MTTIYRKGHNATEYNREVMSELKTQIFKYANYRLLYYQTRRIPVLF